jgi:tripeptidyl-peptidase-1
VDGTSCSEANLDVQYLMAVSQNTPTSFMYWNGTDFWLDWITSVAEMTHPPLVISISYVQNEHDVSQSYADAFNFEAMKLSLAGVTLVVASGDDGAAGLDAREDVMRCGFFPQFPATSPYVTSIGATKVCCISFA